MKTIRIASHTVGPGQPCLIIAEAGVNHNGSLATALKLVEGAAAAHADAIKFQTFHAERLVINDAPKARYQQQNTATDESQQAMLKKLELSEDDHRVLLQACSKYGLIFLSSPFDTQCVDFLDALGVPAFKIGSGELTNLPLLTHTAQKNKPIILSTGMATMEEVDQAVQTVHAVGNRDLLLLHCVSAYPAPADQTNLLAMYGMAEKFKLPVGYSDHTTGIDIAIAATAMGACVIEKHFTLDRQAAGPDHRASLEVQELAAMVWAIRNVEAALGDGEKRPAPCEKNTLETARKSIVAARDIARGTTITGKDIVMMRPGTGISPARRDVVIGSQASCDISANTVLQSNMLKPGDPAP